jgi:hypothetical protein
MQPNLASKSFVARPRRVWISALIVAASVMVALWYRQATEPSREAAKLHALILSLAVRRPNNLTSKQWESAIAWTNNLHSNSLPFEFTDGPAIRSLRLQLEAKLESPVTIETINWIWDQYAELCPLGARYQPWRKVMLDEIEIGGGNWGMTIP